MQEGSVQLVSKQTTTYVEPGRRGSTSDTISSVQRRGSQVDKAIRCFREGVFRNSTVKEINEKLRNSSRRKSNDDKVVKVMENDVQDLYKIDQQALYDSLEEEEERVLKHAAEEDDSYAIDDRGKYQVRRSVRKSLEKSEEGLLGGKGLQIGKDVAGKEEQGRESNSLIEKRSSDEQDRNLMIGVKKVEERSEAMRTMSVEEEQEGRRRRRSSAVKPRKKQGGTATEMRNESKIVGKNDVAAKEEERKEGSAEVELEKLERKIQDYLEKAKELPEIEVVFEGESWDLMTSFKLFVRRIKDQKQEISRQIASKESLEEELTASNRKLAKTSEQLEREREEKRDLETEVKELRKQVREIEEQRLGEIRRLEEVQQKKKKFDEEEEPEEEQEKKQKEQEMKEKEQEEEKEVVLQQVQRRSQKKDEQRHLELKETIGGESNLQQQKGRGQSQSKYPTLSPHKGQSPPPQRASESSQKVLQKVVDEKALKSKKKSPQKTEKQHKSENSRKPKKSSQQFQILKSGEIAVESTSQALQQKSLQLQEQEHQKEQLQELHSQDSQTQLIVAPKHQGKSVQEEEKEDKISREQLKEKSRLEDRIRVLESDVDVIVKLEERIKMLESQSAKKEDMEADKIQVIKESAKETALVYTKRVVVSPKKEMRIEEETSEFIQGCSSSSTAAATARTAAENPRMTFVYVDPEGARVEGEKQLNLMKDLLSKQEEDGERLKGIIMSQKKSMELLLGEIEQLVQENSKKNQELFRAITEISIEPKNSATIASSVTHSDDEFSFGNESSYVAYDTVLVEGSRESVVKAGEEEERKKKKKEEEEEKKEEDEKKKQEKDEKDKKIEVQVKPKGKQQKEKNAKALKKKK